MLGGNGFLGSHLVDRLLAGGHEVAVLDRAPPPIGIHWAGVRQFHGALEDGKVVSEALLACDTVYHLVSTTVPSTSNLDPVADIHGNLIATVRVLDLMVKYGVRKIVYFSSGGTVYGDVDADQVDETNALAPVCSYGVVKVGIENYLGMYAHLYGLEPTVLRASNPYGARQGHSGLQGLIGTCLVRVAQGLPIEIWGDGSIVRDYIYVDDLARLAVLSGQSRQTGIFNAGSGVGHSVAEVVSAIGRVTGRKSEIIYRPARAFDVRRIVLAVEKAKNAFDWQPLVELEEGLDFTWRALNH